MHHYYNVSQKHVCFLIGTTYFQQDQPLLIMAGFCVYSVASALFMFPVMQNYFIKALEVYNAYMYMYACCTCYYCSSLLVIKVYRFENADGAGRAGDIVIQAVARFSTMAVVPVVLCSSVLYLLVNAYMWSGIIPAKLYSYFAVYKYDTCTCRYLLHYTCTMYIYMYVLASVAAITIEKIYIYNVCATISLHKVTNSMLP